MVEPSQFKPVSRSQKKKKTGVSPLKSVSICKKLINSRGVGADHKTRERKIKRKLIKKKQKTKKEEKKKWTKQRWNV